MDVALLDLADRVRPWVGQCPSDLISQALLDVIRDFCNWTRAFQLEDTDTVQPTVSDYDVSLAANVELISIEEMTVNGAECKAKTPAWLTQYVAANWRTRQADDFRFYTTLTPGSFTFPCVPTHVGTPGGVAYRASARPRLTAIGVDDALANEYLEVWSAGALGKLKGIGGEHPPSWYDPVGAKEKTAEYRHGRSEVRIRINNAFNNPEQRMANRRGFA